MKINNVINFIKYRFYITRSGELHSCVADLKLFEKHQDEAARSLCQIALDTIKHR